MAANSDRISTGERLQTIVTASWIGIVGNGVLAVVKLIAGFVSGSAAVLSDGIDSALDILTSMISLIAARITSIPPDVHHPYGHSRAETIATKSLSFVIFFAGAQLAISSVGGIVSGDASQLPTLLAIYVTIVSIAGKAALAWYKFAAGKRTGSLMLVADAKNMRSDIVISVAVLIGVSVTVWLEIPLFDRITALGVSLYIMWVAFGIFVDTNSELMEGHGDPDTYQRIFDAVAAVPGAEHPHRTRIRTIGGLHIVDLDIEVDGTLSVQEAHAIAQITERAIRGALDNVYDVLVHVEPLGNVESAERYGLSQRKLDEFRS
ncbi:MAG: cation transporter [Spirochaetaceae bacterium]|nr:MAG: cation transporter [Spirochaetaceae bacterium]